MRGGRPSPRLAKGIRDEKWAEIKVGFVSEHPDMVYKIMKCHPYKITPRHVVIDADLHVDELGEDFLPALESYLQAWNGQKCSVKVNTRAERERDAVVTKIFPNHRIVDTSVGMCRCRDSRQLRKAQKVKVRVEPGGIGAFAGVIL